MNRPEPFLLARSPLCKWQTTSSSWAVTFGGYLGAGFEVTFGSDSGNSFVTFRAGLGVGGGASYDPHPSIPGPDPANRNSSGWVLSDSAQANFNAGPLSANLEVGAARNYSNGASSVFGGASASATSSKGIDASASVGAQATVLLAAH